MTWRVPPPLVPAIVLEQLGTPPPVTTVWVDYWSTIVVWRRNRPRSPWRLWRRPKAWDAVIYPPATGAVHVDPPPTTVILTAAYRVKGEPDMYIGGR